jgi:Dyp-type peroxidase family
MGSKRTWHNNGSFLAFRKIEQDVNGLWNLLTEKYESRKTDIKPEELAAKMVGRWKSGAPLAERDFDPVSPEFSSHNDFVYLHNNSGAINTQNDLEGVLTPRFSHIRVANPRDSDREGGVEFPRLYLKENDRHKILRRGIPYGPSWSKDQDMRDAGAENAKNSRGLLFICYQRDLAVQFEYIQSKLADTQNWQKMKGFHETIPRWAWNTGLKQKAEGTFFLLLFLPCLI